MKTDKIKLTKRRIDYLNKCGLNSIEKLVNLLPQKYEDLSVTSFLKNLEEQKVILLGKIISEPKLKFIKKNLSLIEFYVEINEEPYKIILFNREFLLKSISVGETLKIKGKLNYIKKEIVASNIYFDIKQNVIVSYKLEAGMKDFEFNKIVNMALEYIEQGNINLNVVPIEFINKYRLLDKVKCLKMAHNPKNIEEVSKSFRHFKYEELLEFALSMEINKRLFKENKNKEGMDVNDEIIKAFLSTLPYKPSESQSIVINEIINDLKSSSNMYRILQGDVGSGKTLVGLASMIACFSAKKQSAMMVPTDLLARQHFLNISELVIKSDVKVALLVADMNLKQKQLIKDKIFKGEIDILIGTHALIQKDVVFKNLGFVIIDEQHRFGVNQRKILKEKGKSVDLLLMSATPIPRSLAQTVYGDLDISTLEGFPQGKRKVETQLLLGKKKDKVLKYVEEDLKKGNNVFVICPLIDGDETKAVTSIYLIYKNKFANYGVGMLHGRLSEEVKIKTLKDFEEGTIRILVSTTVIEVGIDIRGANTMVVYGSNNFGMAQLHQLRGRIGRDGKDSRCFLLTDAQDEEVIDKLEFFQSSQDGFEISRYDMQKRGIGDIIGTRQSGVSDLKTANIVDDYKILEVARKDVKEIYLNIEKKEYKNYLNLVKCKMKKNIEFLN